MESSDTVTLAAKWRAWCLGGLCLLWGTGCASTNYQYGRFHADGAAPAELVVEYGRPQKTLDRMRRVVTLPQRILSPKKEHLDQPSAETTEKLAAYLKKNDLTDLHVTVHQYDPKGEWQRLRENDRISPGWRYTVGTLSVVGYTLLPSRVFGRDRYNPFTDTLEINSDVPAHVLYEAACAKDLRARKHPGTYAAINELPLITVWHQSHATGDVLGYARAENDWETEKQAYRVLYSHIGSSSTSIAGPFVSPLLGPALGLGGAVVGRTAGLAVESRRSKEREHEIAEPPAKAAVDEVQLTGFEKAQPESKP